MPIGEWRTIGVRLKNEEISTLNLRLKQLGYDTLGEFAQALTKGIVSNRQLVEELAEVVADRVVNKLLTNTEPKELPLNMVEQLLLLMRQKGPPVGLEPTT